MGSFVMLHTAVWRDDDFLRLTDTARLLFIWSWSNDLSGPSGLYRASFRMLGREPFAAPLPEDAVGVALDELGRKPMVVYDYDDEVIWVVNRAGYSMRSPNQRVRMRRDYDRCPLGRVRTLFKERYGEALDLPGQED